MTSTPSKLLRKSAAVANRSTERVKREGVGDLLWAASSRTRYRSIAALFETVFGSITREELRNRARADGRYWEYGSTETFEVRNQNVNDVPALFREFAGSYEVDRPFVCELAGGVVIDAADPFVLTRDRELVMETEKPLFGPRDAGTTADTPFHKRTEYSECTASERLTQLCRGYVRARDWSDRGAEFDAVFPLVRRVPSYAHWLVDQLPTVRGLQRYRAATGRNPTVLVEPDPPEWILESLALVGVEDPVPFDMEFVETDRLVVASCRESVPRNQSVYEPSKADIDWLTSEIQSRVPESSSDYPDRIYVSRENLPGRGRNVTNRAELNSVLEEFEIEVCTPETRSLADQVRLYENAEIIVGPHGAGLTNMIFSRNASVIELLSTPYPMYEHLAQLSGHEYRVLKCGDQTDHHAPIEVGPDALRSLLAEVVSDDTTGN